MKTGRLLSWFALLTALLTMVGKADVLVYRGTFLEYDADTSNRTLAGRCFVIFERPTSDAQTAGKAAFVRYYVTPTGPNKGVKTYSKVPPEEARFGGAERPDEKVLRAISHAEALVAEPGFAHASYFFRGVQVAIPLVPGLNNSVITTQEPATLKGSSRTSGVSFVGKYTERTYSLKQDVQRTLESNAGHLSINTTLTNIENYVKTLGYQ